jgi:hypothetical protein
VKEKEGVTLFTADAKSHKMHIKEKFVIKSILLFLQQYIAEI